MRVGIVVVGVLLAASVLSVQPAMASSNGAVYLKNTVITAPSPGANPTCPAGRTIYAATTDGPGATAGKAYLAMHNPGASFCYDVFQVTASHDMTVTGNLH